MHVEDEQRLQQMMKQEQKEREWEEQLHQQLERERWEEERYVCNVTILTTVY